MIFSVHALVYKERHATLFTTGLPLFSGWQLRNVVVVILTDFMSWLKQLLSKGYTIKRNSGGKYLLDMVYFERCTLTIVGYFAGWNLLKVELFSTRALD